MLTLEVGKKYLDSNGSVWVICDQPTPSFYAAELVGSTNLPSIVRQDGEFLFVLNNLVSEVPTTPQFKVGDRVRVKVPVPQYYTEMYGTIDREEDGRFGVVTFDNFGEWFYPSELEHLTDTTPTYVPTCTCETFLLMREGCRCGHARVAIEKEFKREGWR